MAITPSQIELERRDEAFDLLASKFPKRYGVKGTEYLRGLLEAFATGDGYIASQIEAARDNLIAVTATGSYLDRRAGLYGIVRGQGAGLLDGDFQKLIPKLGFSPKQITNIMLQLVDTIYGPYASHANTTSSISEPYVMEDGFNLKVRVDDTEINVVFETEDFLNISTATAQEIATAISKKTAGRLIGSVLTNARTGEKFLNIRTSTIGAQGFIQVIGGDAQAKLRFPETRDVTNAIRTWSVTRYLGTDEMVFTVASGPVPNLSAAGVSRGDIVSIRADSGFALNNTGNFEVTFVGTNYFRLRNGDGVEESSITQNQADDFTFFKPDLENVLLTARPAAILETSAREITVILPVTSPIVKRTLRGGHHFHQGYTTVNSATSNTVTIGSTSGFATSGAFKPVLARDLSSGVISSIGASTATLINADGWPAQGAFTAGNNPGVYYYYNARSGNQLQGVTPAPPASIVGAEVKYVSRYKYTGTSGSTLTGVYPDPSSIVGQEIFANDSIIESNFPGSFMYDPDAQFICSKNAALIQDDVNRGDVKTLIPVDDCTNFDETGNFVLEFGTSNQEGPIRYLAKIGTTGIVCDPSHVFSKDHLSGARIRMIRQLGPYVPKTDGRDLAVYHTSTSPARDLLATYLRLIAASGVSFRFEIRIPEQKWEVKPNLYSTDPLATELVVV